MNVAFLKEIKQYEQEKEITLVAVSKTKPNEDIQACYDFGQRIFGENKVQELVSKHESLPSDIQWHMIGHLQTNKVKYIASFVDLVHSVDRLSLLDTLQKEAHKADRMIDFLLQVKIATEHTKMGASDQDALDLIDHYLQGHYPNVRCVGVMGMASFVQDESVVRSEFRHLRLLFERLKNNQFANIRHFQEVSMGMSGDYEIAVEEGATIIRVGSKIFGNRNYANT